MYSEPVSASILYYCASGETPTHTPMQEWDLKTHGSSNSPTEALNSPSSHIP